MTDRQRRFVDEYLVDLNATQAAIRAGYSRHTASVIGCENLGKPEIQAAISEAMQQRQRSTGITHDKILEALAAVAFSEEEDAAKVRNQLRALELLGKHLGMFSGKRSEEDGEEGTGVVLLPPVMENPGPP